jgi:hypothetical protein
MLAAGLRVRVEIMGSQTCGIVEKVQPVLIMINPIIFTRTRTLAQRPDHCTLRGAVIRLQGSMPARSERTQHLLTKFKMGAQLSCAVKRNSARRKMVGFAQVSQAFHLSSAGDGGMNAATAKKVKTLQSRIRLLEGELEAKTAATTDAEDALTRLKASTSARLHSAAAAHKSTVGEHKRAMADVRHKHAEQLQQLQARHAQTLHEQHTAHSTALQAARSESASELRAAADAREVSGPLRPFWRPF